MEEDQMQMNEKYFGFWILFLTHAGRLAQIWQKKQVSNLERYRRSAIPDMQRKLKQSLMEQRILMNNIVTSEL